MDGSDRSDEAVSSLQANLLLVALAMILAALVLLMFHLPSFYLDMTGEPCIFEIVSINHLDEDGHTLKYDSRVTLRYNSTPASPDIRDPVYLMREYLGCREDNADRTAWYKKDDLSAQFYKNSEPLPSRIPTMEAHEFISTHHYGVQYITGTGSVWCPDGRITIDFTDGTFRPGDIVRVEIYSNADGRLISADTYTA
jgi:hypothetical protein